MFSVAALHFISFITSVIHVCAAHGGVVLEADALVALLDDLHRTFKGIVADLLQGAVIVVRLCSGNDIELRVPVRGAAIDLGSKGAVTRDASLGVVGLAFASGRIIETYFFFFTKMDACSTGSIIKSTSLPF